MHQHIIIKTKPIIQNAGVLQIPPKSISILPVQVPTELNTKHIYQLNASNDQPSSIITLAVDHSMHHKYAKLLNIPLPNTKYDTFHIPRKTMLGILNPIDSENI